MAEIEGKKISGVPERTELTGNELYPFADSGSQGHVKGSVLKAYCATPIGEVEGTAFDGARGKAVENKLSEGFIINHYLDNNLSNGNEIVLTRTGVSGENGEKYYAQDTIPSATTTKAGVMSANDKKNLDNVAGLYYISYETDEWVQKIKDAAGNSRGVYINCGSDIPLLGLSFKNDNVYGHVGGGIIMASKSEMGVHAYVMPNLDNPDEYYSAKILLKTGGDGSKFLSDDGTYKAIEIPDISNLATKTELNAKVSIESYNADKATFATKTELANKLDTSTYNSDKAGFATKTELNNKKNITIVQEVADASSSVSFNLDPNTLKKMGEVGTITVLGFTTTGLQSNELAEYAFEFKSGDTPTVLTMPESVKWIGDHTIEANKTYQVSIVNNLAVMGGA